MSKREGIWRAIEADPEVPVLILGGGINGVGLFRELALQGVDCLLIDKSDFVAGASSKSSRMIHGGLRYLENGEFKLVREALRERNLLLDNAAHYVSPLKTTIPLFSWMAGLIRSPLVFMRFPINPGGRGALLVKLGLWFYDLVTRKSRRTPKHFLSSKARSLRNIPGLNRDVVATVTYWDAWITHAERLCIEMIRDACAGNPSCRALNYVSVASAQNDVVVLTDEVSGEQTAVRPRLVVNATGGWVDLANAALGVQTRFMGPTKGSHLVVDSPDLYEALGDQMIYYEHDDGRVCIVFRFLDKVIMGSTDIRVDDPDGVSCDDDEIAYMMTTLRGVFPDLEIRRDQIVYKYCGVRPLPAADGDVTAKISRDHQIETLDPDGQRAFPIVCLIGGKWTTFRGLAEQAADRVLSRLGLERRTSTEHIPIGGGSAFPVDETERRQWIERVASASGLSRERLAVLLDRYGTFAEEVARNATAASETPLTSLPDYTVSEIEHIVVNESVVHLTDLICRRSLIAILGHARPDVIEELTDLAARSLGWDADRKQSEIAAALQEVRV